ATPATRSGHADHPARRAPVQETGRLSGAGGSVVTGTPKGGVGSGGSGVGMGGVGAGPGPGGGAGSGTGGTGSGGIGSGGVGSGTGGVVIARRLPAAPPVIPGVAWRITRAFSVMPAGMKSAGRRRPVGER